MTLIMRRTVTLLLCVLAALGCAFGIRLEHQAATEAAVRKQGAQPAENALPKRLLWIWERPEDLHTIDPATAAAAVYRGTLILGETPVFQPRRNPYLLPLAAKTVSVVRIEIAPRFAAHTGDASYRKQAVSAVAHVANEPGIGALQIDFDAPHSARSFYTLLLRDVRNAIPAALPLDITALVSWCDEDDWIGNLPVNSATPMFFRMEPGRKRFAQRVRLSAKLPEPLCNTTVGISTHEPLPTDIAARRVYLFPDGGWQRDLPLLSQPDVPHRKSPAMEAPTAGSQFRPKRSEVEKAAVLTPGRQTP